MIKVYLPKTLYNKLYLLLLDPFTKKPKYGALSAVAERGITQVVEDIEQNGLPAYLQE